MTANELNLLIDILERRGEDRQLEAATMLRNQQAEIELLSSDNKHYRNMAVDFLRCREPYGWHCFIGKGKEKQDFLFINGKGASKPDASWDKVIPLYTHPVKEHDIGISHAIGFDDGFKAGMQRAVEMNVVKDLEDIDINITWNENSMRDFGKDELNFARAILKKASENV